MKPTSSLRLILVIGTFYTLQLTQTCSLAFADDPILGSGGGGGLVFGGGARTDEGADGLVNTGGGGLVFGGGARSEGMAPDDGADGLGHSGGGPVTDLETNDGPAEPNDSSQNKPCPAAYGLFAAALVLMGENPCAPTPSPASSVGPPPHNTPILNPQGGIIQSGTWDINSDEWGLRRSLDEADRRARRAKRSW